MSALTAAAAVAGFRTVLAGVPSLRPVVGDEDVYAYLAGLLAEAEGGVTSPSRVQALAGPFFESFGVEGDALTRACSEVYTKAVEAGLVRAGGGGDASGVPGAAGGSKATSTRAMAKAMLAAADGVAGGAGVLLRGGADAHDDEEEAPVRMLSAPVKLGSGPGINATSLDFLWGKQNNAYLNQNAVVDYSEVMSSKATKKAAREARKEMDRLRFQKAKAEAERAEEAATDAAAGKVSSGTVTYTLTTERKTQDINIHAFTLGYGGEPLLDAADLKITAGRRYGLVGRNGMGKSTLLRHMARGDIEGAGAQKFPTNLRVLHVEQEVVGSDATVLGTVLGSDVERALLLEEEARLTALLGAEGEGTATSPAATGGGEEGVASGGGGAMTAEAAAARLKEVAVRLAEIDADSAEARAAAILSGLSFTKEMHDWPTKSLSGGWRMRVALACALFCEPDVLCLDEPTNHIDARSILWLVEYLLTYPHTLLIVSHDRWFLNAVCTDIVHLNNKKLEYYKGDYDTFERTRAEKRRHLEKATESQDAKRKHIQAFIDKFRYNAKRASLVQSRIKAIERMDVLEEVVDDPKWRFEFPDPGALGIPVLQISDVTFGYRPDRPLFKGVNFSIDMTSRIALVGPNGVGKSTLLKLILGELEPQSGVVNRNSKLRMACFTQHHINQLDLSATPCDFLLRLFPGSKPDAVRAHLGSFGLSGDLALQTIGTMSGGQKSRVAFSILTWKKPHVLILDEPSNNLDIETIDAVIVALANFTGGVIVVSHDQHFVESVCDEIYVMGGQRVTKFKGEFKDYRKVAESEKAFRVDGGTATGGGAARSGAGAKGGAGAGAPVEDEEAE